MPSSILFAALSWQRLLGEDWLPLIVGLAAMVVVAVMLAVTRTSRRSAPQAEVKAAEVKPAEVKVPDHDPFLQGSTSEKRVGLRIKGGSVKVLIRGPGCMKDPLLGWVVDRSARGLGLAVDREFPNGTRLLVQPADESAATPWVEVEVRFAEREKGRWQLGCKFLASPPYDVLLNFG